jgi:hypothetical protein
MAVSDTRLVTTTRSHCVDFIINSSKSARTGLIDLRPYRNLKSALHLAARFRHFNVALVVVSPRFLPRNPAR